MKLTKKEKEALYDKVYNYKLDNDLGFTSEEIKEIKESYDDISEDHFFDALSGNTCGMVNGKIRTYRVDIYHALLCGLEGRNLSIDEWD